MITIDIVRVYDGYREELWRKLCYYFDVKQTMKRFLTNLTKIVAKCTIYFAHGARLYVKIRSHSLIRRA